MTAAHAFFGRDSRWRRDLSRRLVAGEPDDRSRILREVISRSPQPWHYDGLSAAQRQLKGLIESGPPGAGGHGKSRRSTTRPSRLDSAMGQHGRRLAEGFGLLGAEAEAADAVVRWQGLGLEDAVTRDHLGGGGFTLQRGHVSTGRPTGRRRRERTLTGLPASEVATALVIDELERETRCQSRHFASSSAEVDLIRGEPCSPGPLQHRRHRTEQLRPRSIAGVRPFGGYAKPAELLQPKPRQKGGSPRALPPPSESSLAERREAA